MSSWSHWASKASVGPNGPKPLGKVQPIQSCGTGSGELRRRIAPTGMSSGPVSSGAGGRATGRTGSPTKARGRCSMMPSRSMLARGAVAESSYARAESCLQRSCARRRELGDFDSGWSPARPRIRMPGWEQQREELVAGPEAGARNHRAARTHSQSPDARLPPLRLRHHQRIGEPHALELDKPRESARGPNSKKVIASGEVRPFVAPSPRTA